MARRVVVDIVGDSTKLERAFKRSERSANRFDRSMKRMSGFGRGAFAGFAGAAGLSIVTDQLREMVSVAAESQNVLGQTRVAVKQAGLSWETYGKQIEATVAAQSRLGFDDEALLRTFSLFVRQSDNVSEALRRNQIAMDVARARYIDLEAAAALVNKAALGQAGALRRVGIDAKTGASGVELLNQLEKEFGGSAEAASHDASTSMQRFSVEVENMKESIGTLLLPIVSELADVLGNAATATTTLTTELGKLGQIKIPEIELPFNITIGGKNLGSLAGGAALKALKSTPGIGPLFQILDLLEKAGKGGGAGAAGLPSPDIGFRAAGVLAPPKKKRRTVTTGPSAAEQRNRWFDDAISRQLDRVQDIATLRGQIVRLREIAGLIQQRISITKDITRKLTLGDQLASIMRQIRGDQEQIAAEAARQAEEQKRKRQEMMDAMLDQLHFNIERTALTKSLNDDLKAWQKYQAAVRKLIATQGKTLDLQRKLLDAELAIKDIREQQQANRDEFAKFKPIDATKFVQALGFGNLSAGQIRTLIGAIAGISRGGKVPPSRTAAFAGAAGVTINGGVNLYGVQNPKQMEEQLAKRAGARPQLRRGAR